MTVERRRLHTDPECDIAQREAAQQAAVEGAHPRAARERVAQGGLDAAAQLLAAPAGVRRDEEHRDHDDREQHETQPEPREPAERAAHQ